MQAAFAVALEHSPHYLPAPLSSAAAASPLESKSVSSGEPRAVADSAAAALSGKSAKLLDVDIMKDKLDKHCCKEECLRNLTFNQLETLRSFYSDLGSEAKRLQWLVLYCRDHPLSDAGFQLFSLCGRSVCARAFFAAYGLSGDKFYHARRLAAHGSGALAAVHGNAGRDAPLEDRVRGWQQRYFARHCDQPAADRWILPGCETWSSLFDQYSAECELYALGEPAAQRYFHAVRRSLFSHVFLARQSDHARCDECVQLRSLLAVATAGAAQEAARRMRSEHMQAQRLERDLLIATELAAKESHPFLHLGADYFSSLPIPHFRQTPKTFERLAGVDINAAGTIETGTDETLIFFHLPKISKNPNSVITFLYLHLASILRRGFSAGASADAAAAARAPELILQLDNSWAQNKNRWTIAFAALLVERGYFSAVTMRFLWRHHAHWRLDQRFAALMLAFRRANVYDAYKLWTLVHSHCAKLHAVMVEGVLDWKRFFSDHLFALTGHTGIVDGVATGGPRGMRFTLDGSGHAVFVYSDAPGAAEPVWRGEGGVARGAAGFAPIRVLRSVPQGVPPRAPTIWLDSESQEREAAAFAHYQQQLLRLLPSAVDGRAASEEVAWRYNVIRTGTLGLTAHDADFVTAKVGQPAMLKKRGQPALTVSSFDGSVVDEKALWASFELRKRVMLQEVQRSAAAEGKDGKEAKSAGLPQLPHSVIRSGAAAGGGGGGGGGAARGGQQKRTPKRRRDGFNDEEEDEGLGLGGGSSGGGGGSGGGGDDEGYEVAALLAKRPGPPGCSAEYLVEWRNYGPEEASWQPLENVPGDLVREFEDLYSAHADAASERKQQPPAAAAAEAAEPEDEAAAPPAAAFIGQRDPSHSVRGVAASVVASDAMHAQHQQQPQQQAPAAPAAQPAAAAASATAAGGRKRKRAQMEASAAAAPAAGEQQPAAAAAAESKQQTAPAVPAFRRSTRKPKTRAVPMDTGDDGSSAGGAGVGGGAGAGAGAGQQPQQQAQTQQAAEPPAKRQKKPTGRQPRKAR